MDGFAVSDCFRVLSLSTPRLRLRPLSLDDVAKIYAMSLEAGMRRFIPDQVYRDVDQAEQVVRALAVAIDAGLDPRVRPCVLGVEHEREVIGHVGLSPCRDSVEIGYAIEQRLHGQGFASEAVLAMTTWGLGTLALTEILGIVDVENLASRRVLEHAEFVCDDDQAPTKLVYRRTR